MNTANLQVYVEQFLLKTKNLKSWPKDLFTLTKWERKHITAAAATGQPLPQALITLRAHAPRSYMTETNGERVLKQLPPPVHSKKQYPEAQPFCEKRLWLCHHNCNLRGRLQTFLETSEGGHGLCALPLSYSKAWASLRGQLLYMSGSPVFMSGTLVFCSFHLGHLALVGNGAYIPGSDGP